MNIKIDGSYNNESKEDCQIELDIIGDSLDIAVASSWDNGTMKYKKYEWVSLKENELIAFFNAVKAIEATMKNTGNL